MKYLATILILGFFAVIFAALTPGTTVLEWVTLMLVGMCLQVLMNEGRRND